MTLTVCVGSSGSGKTTFLNDVRNIHKCTYIRQYHNMRPYITVRNIPNFDPTKLPFWKIYETEGTAESIKVGGTMAGTFTAGFSGGQRKLLLFELICQRTANQSELLIVLDEPFAGVTDDFVPFIKERLNEMRKNHNILLVTNDHVEALTDMADNTIRVSAVDRANVHINNREHVDREKAIMALAVGDEYLYTASSADLRFFIDTEILSNGALLGIAIFTTFAFLLFIATFWNSSPDSTVLVLVAGGIISYFCCNPYLLSLVDWRVAMLEEAEALVHASKGMNKALKLLLTLTIILIISVIEFGVVNAVVSGLSDVKYWVSMLFDSASLTFPLVCLGIYTHMPFQAVQILGSLPFLLMIFLSTTFSPGAGIPVLKALRYLYARFYFWCSLEGVQDQMEGCPPSNLNTLYLVLSALLGSFIFVCFQVAFKIRKRFKKVAAKTKKANMADDEEFKALQIELYGKKALKRFKHREQTMDFTENGRATSEANLADNDDVYA